MTHQVPLMFDSSSTLLLLLKWECPSLTTAPFENVQVGVGLSKLSSNTLKQPAT